MALTPRWSTARRINLIAGLALLSFAPSLALAKLWSETVGDGGQTANHHVAMATAGGARALGWNRSTARVPDGRASADGFAQALDVPASPYVMMRSANLQDRSGRVGQANGEVWVTPDFDAVGVEP